MYVSHNSNQKQPGIPSRPVEDNYGDGDVPEVDTERYRNGSSVEPLPESFRERRDGPGGN